MCRTLILMYCYFFPSLTDRNIGDRGREENWHEITGSDGLPVVDNAGVVMIKLLHFTAPCWLVEWPRSSWDPLTLRARCAKPGSGTNLRIMIPPASVADNNTEKGSTMFCVTALVQWRKPSPSGLWLGETQRGFFFVLCTLKTSVAWAPGTRWLRIWDIISFCVHVYPVSM